MKRGEIWYVNKTENMYAAEYGAEMQSGRPAIVISTPRDGRVVTVVYLTTQPREDLPTHVSITSSGRPSVALCEQVTTVDAARIGSYSGTCTDKEMEMVDLALMAALGIEVGSKPVKILLDNDSVRIRAERDVYKQMYEKILEDLIE